MTMPPRVRKAALTTHVACSVGWLGAVAGSLALAVAGLVTDDEQTMRGIYLALDVIGWFALVPLSLASLATGVVQGLGTKWGLFRYWWVVVKLVITVVAVIVLLMYTQTLGALADLARGASAASGEGETLPSPSPALHTAVALLLLLVTTTLAVFKPPGITAFGRRRRL
jgi:hypothetical protein